MPPSLVYEMVAKAMGSHIIPMQITGNNAIYGFASNNKQTRSTQVYLINKSEFEVRVQIVPVGSSFKTTMIEKLVAPGKLLVERSKDGSTSIALAPMSFTRIVGSGQEPQE